MLQHIAIQVQSKQRVNRPYILQQKTVQFQSKQRVNRSYILQQKAVQFQSKQVMYVTANSHTSSK